MGGVSQGDGRAERVGEVGGAGIDTLRYGFVANRTRTGRGCRVCCWVRKVE